MRRRAKLLISFGLSCVIFVSRQKAEMRKLFIRVISFGLRTESALMSEKKKKELINERTNEPTNQPTNHQPNENNNT